MRRFLCEVDARQRTDRIRSIYDLRVAQADLKHFKEAMRKLEQHDRLIRLREARQDGQRLLDVELTEREENFLATQSQEFASDWSEARREQFKREQAGLWAMIPEAHRLKAERYARGH